MTEKYAIFFPQFHRVRVNDDAWGYCFDDWALVSAANAFDLWHRRAPAKGYYDLSNSDEVESQFETARDYGLDGFGIYHYWFRDGPELSAVESYLAENDVPDNFGFFFIWANEDWSKRWAGKDTEILHVVEKEPGTSDIKRHVNYLAPFMLNRSYKKVNGRPVFVLYRSEVFSDIEKVVSDYREEFHSAGIDVEFGLAIKRYSDFKDLKWFDFAYIFEPRFYHNFTGVRGSKIANQAFRLASRVLPTSLSERLFSLAGKVIHRSPKKSDFCEYSKYFFSDHRLKLFDSHDKPVQNIISCGWNNAPRYRENAVKLVDVPAEDEFSDFMSKYSDHYSFSDYPLLCNAWNEWSEGAALEPCYYYNDYLIKCYVGFDKSNYPSVQ